ncbi:hypothetical protein COL922a_000050 [Colletotrichum nupharicola]|nr:hypothetical protein COL922a_000050 [Colletotrichum nupharicola]
MAAFLVVAALAVCAGAAAGQRRYAAVDMSPAGGGGALVPRFFIDEPRLVARDGAPCPANAHSCLDIGFPNQCCSNENYCYVKPNGDPWCCQIGSNCDSKCSASQYQCTDVVAVTMTPTSTGDPTVTSSTVSACCYRGCPSTSNFRCADQFGGGCCPYGNTCASSKQCIQTISATSSSTAGGLTPADPGCTATTQHACADGQGCCDDLMHCTSVSGTAACAPGNPTATDVTYDPDSNGGGGGLSAGAKAGIGVGVSVVGLALVGVLAWFCLVRRRRRRGATTMTASSQRSGGGGGGLSNVIGGGAASSRPGRSARAMSEVTSGSRPTARRGATQDYFGPDAVAGPYTETETVASAEGAATVASSPGRHRGVPLQAHSPSDVVAPVEIDSRVKRGAPAAVTSVSQQALAPSSPPTTEGRFELYGSEMPSPTSPGMPPPPLMTPSARSVSMMARSPIDRSPGPAPSPEPRRR